MPVGHVGRELRLGVCSVQHGVWWRRGLQRGDADDELDVRLRARLGELWRHLRADGHRDLQWPRHMLGLGRHGHVRVRDRLHRGAL
jgi:hypothetical protein